MKPKLYFDVNQLPTILTIAEAALYLRCDVNVLKVLAREGSFPAYKLTADGRWYIQREDLLGFVEKRKQERHPA